MTDPRTPLRAVIIFILSFWAFSVPVVAQVSLPKRITLLVGFAPGQGNDQPAQADATRYAASRMSPDLSFNQVARYLARHLGRLLPGNPVLETKYAPGAAGLAAAAMLYAAPNNGRVLGLLSSNAILSSALDFHQGAFRADRFAWIGGVARDNWVCVARGASEPAGPLWIGSLGAGSRSDVHARAIRDLTPVKINVLPGYAGRFELVRALEAGEIDGACGWPINDLERRYGAWLKTGQMMILAQFSSPSMASHRGPIAPQLAENAIARGLLETLAVEGELAWPLAAPPDAPSSLIELLSETLSLLASDREAVEDAIRMGLALDPVSGSETAERVRTLHALTSEDKSTLARFFARP